MIRCDVNSDYFNWLINSVCKDGYSKNISFTKLLTYLHETRFKYFIPNDENRALDGVSLRHRFARENFVDSDREYIETCLRGPCSVLEMIVALAIRCEETIMDDTRYGDRTSQWFWGMINSLGLGSMSDNRFDREYVTETVERFMNRDYESNGRGGLFTIRGCDTDLRKIGIWTQLCWYLDSIL